MVTAVQQDPLRDAEASWHSLRAESSLRRLRADPDGLSEAEAGVRRRRYGPNKLPQGKRRSTIGRFLMQFHNVLIYVLIGSAVITAALSHWPDTGVILGVVLINAIVGFVQEGKAERALEALTQLLAQHATVRREGRWRSIAAEELVPGDIVSLQSGDKVPADLRLLAVRELRADESMLTGESAVVEKSVDPVPESSVVGDRTCIAYSGTLVTYGTGSGVVVATGPATEIGRISALMRAVPTLHTPLLRKMGRFSRILSLIILVCAAATFAFGILVRGYDLADMFVAAVGLAVAAIPEGLPAIMTVTLAIGVRRMAQRNAIIRRLPAVETLGAVTVICSDKTGTLTRNEMTVRTVALSGGRISVDGEGYDPHGEFSRDGATIDPGACGDLLAVVRAGLLCNDAELHRAEERWQLSGDPTEGALIVLAAKAGLATDLLRAEYPRQDAIPFESQHRYMATLHHDHEGHGFVYLKGAPERVLGMCSRQRRDGGDEALAREDWETQMRRMAENGERLLAIAVKPWSAPKTELAFDDVQSGFVLLGIVGMIDPPRSDAVDAIGHCDRAGIQVKMITGDHLLTAQAVGATMGLHGPALAGAELDQLDDAALQRAVAHTRIFARASPEHKLRLVTALQANGEIVAMTGDGVNDAPALRRADVGIAMGRKGTDVAKEAAEVVLTDDNFASIARAVAEGRTVFDNLKKSILFILPTSGGEALTILAAIVMGRVLPITPAQVLWVNMVTAVTLALALAFEPPEPDLMGRPPRPPQEPLLSLFLVWRTIFVSLVLVAGTFGLFLWYRQQGADVAGARTVAVNTLVFFEIFYLFNCRRLVEPALSRSGLVGNRYVLYAVGLLLVLQLLFTYVSSLQYLFSTVALDLSDWVRSIGVALGVFLLVELEKAWMRRLASSRSDG